MTGKRKKASELEENTIVFKDESHPARATCILYPLGFILAPAVTNHASNKLRRSSVHPSHLQIFSSTFDFHDEDSVNRRYRSVIGQYQRILINTIT